MSNGNYRQRPQQDEVSGDAEVIAIYDEFHLPIYRYIYRQVSNVEVARDLTGDVFHRLLQASQKGIGPRQESKAWLYRTAHNIVVDYYRRQQYRDHLPLFDSIVDGELNLAEKAERHLQADAVRAALKNLTPDQQQVIALKFLAGLTNEETATIMEKPIGAVKSLQHRALEALRRQLVPLKEMTPV